VVARLAQRGDHWEDEHGLVHRIDYTYPVGAVMLTCAEQVGKRAVAVRLTKAPVTCLLCHDISEVFE
jgi:hypothetical protein